MILIASILNQKKLRIIHSSRLVQLNSKSQISGQHRHLMYMKFNFAHIMLRNKLNMNSQKNREAIGCLPFNQ